MRTKKRETQQGCDVAKVIGRIEKTASMAMKICKAVEPLVRVLIKKWGGSNDKMVFPETVA